jgi:hypothetical protein
VEMRLTRIMFKKPSSVARRIYSTERQHYHLETMIVKVDCDKLIYYLLSAFLITNSC